VIQILLIADSILLMLFVSMYFGTGWSMVLFSFPSAKELTVDNYYLVFVSPVERATRFFTGMTALMIITAAVLIVGDWRSGYAWAPLTVLLLVVASTWLTVRWIFPHNRRMREGITDPAILRATLTDWVRLNVLRTALWTGQWLTMAAYFGLRPAR
jgi:hypothetical protein